MMTPATLHILLGAIGGLEVARVMHSPKQVSSSLLVSTKQVSLSLLISTAMLQKIIMIISQKEAWRSKSNTWIGETLTDCPGLLIWMMTLTQEGV
jgi:hypothetical protein